MRRILRILIFMLAAVRVLPAQEHDAGNYPEVLRGEVWMELEPVYGAFIEEKYPLDVETASRRALEEAALFYSAMIYGWSFYYDVGEKARGIPEKLDLALVSAIPFGDSGLRATDVEVKDLRVRLWTDYRLTKAQQHRLQVWKQGGIRSAQAVGYSPLGGPAGASGWLEIKTAALEDAAPAAIRAALRGSERNRPKEVRGFISLASFPRCFTDSGQWAASGRFRLDIQEIVPFAAY